MDYWLWYTKGVKQGMKITKEQASNLLKDDMKTYEGYVNKYVKVKLNQNQFDALVSFAFNTIKLPYSS